LERHMLGRGDERCIAAEITLTFKLWFCELIPR
jgi:hypothetical protein